jgi:hypothetical protein
MLRARRVSRELALFTVYFCGVTRTGFRRWMRTSARAIEHPVIALTLLERVAQVERGYRG